MRSLMAGWSAAHHVGIFMGLLWVALGAGLVGLVWGLKRYTRPIQGDESAKMKHRAHVAK